MKLHFEQALIESLPVGVFILDREGKAVYANSVAQALLGRGIVDGDHAGNLAPRYAAYVAGTSTPYPEAQMPIVRALAGERTRCDDMEIDRNGERIALEVTGTPIAGDDGSIAFAVAVFQDITPRRRAQRALAELNADLESQVASRTAELERTIDALIAAKADVERASRAKSSFLMNISHELRTPLHHIIGFNELLAERLADERTRQMATTAGSSGRDLLAKVDSLIELARTESAEVAELRSLDCGQFHDLVERVAGDRLQPGRMAGRVRVDADVVQLVLQTLLDSSQGTVSLTANEDSLVLRLDDPDLGRRMRNIEHLFGGGSDEARFQQREIDLPLAVARARARATGGELTATDDGVRLCFALDDATAS